MNQQSFSNKITGTTVKMLFLFVVMLSSTAGFSQSIKLGVRAGANLSNWALSGVQGVTTNSLLGPEAALSAEIKLSRSFSIQPELSYSSFGTELKYDNPPTTKFKTSYLLLPVLAKYNLPNGLGFFAGPQAGFLLNAKAKYSSGEKEDAKSVVKKTDFFFVTGLEYNHSSGFGLGVRYNAGLSNIYTQGAEKIRNTSLGVSVSYKFSAGSWNAK